MSKIKEQLRNPLLVRNKCTAICGFVFSLTGSLWFYFRFPGCHDNDLSEGCFIDCNRQSARKVIHYDWLVYWPVGFALCHTGGRTMCGRVGEGVGASVSRTMTKTQFAVCLSILFSIIKVLFYQSSVRLFFRALLDEYGCSFKLLDVHTYVIRFLIKLKIGSNLHVTFLNFKCFWIQCVNRGYYSYIDFSFNFNG